MQPVHAPPRQLTADDHPHPRRPCHLVLRTLCRTARHSRTTVSHDGTALCTERPPHFVPPPDRLGRTA